MGARLYAPLLADKNKSSNNQPHERARTRETPRAEPMAETEATICLSCKFWEGTGGNEFMEWGECHRHPPTMPRRSEQDEEARFANFPIVDGGDWCGEWRDKNQTFNIIRAIARMNATENPDRVGKDND